MRLQFLVGVVLATSLVAACNDVPDVSSVPDGGLTRTNFTSVTSAAEHQCVPELQRDETGAVPCLVLVTFASTSSGPASESDCDGYGDGGYSSVDSSVLASFNAEQAALPDGEGLHGITCALDQIPVAAGQTCAGGDTPGWCYANDLGNAGGGCVEMIAYSSLALFPEGATISLQCISTNAE